MRCKACCMLRGVGCTRGHAVARVVARCILQFSRARCAVASTVVVAPQKWLVYKCVAPQQRLICVALRCAALRCAATIVARLSRRVRVDLHDRSLATHPAAAHTRTHAHTHTHTHTYSLTLTQTHTHTHSTRTHERTHARTDTAVRCHRCRTCGGCARRRRGFYSGSGPPARKQQRCGRCELSSEWTRLPP